MILALPPHTTHPLQLLDVTVFLPLSITCSRNCIDFYARISDVIPLGVDNLGHSLNQLGIRLLVRTIFCQGLERQEYRLLVLLMPLILLNGQQHHPKSAHLASQNSYDSKRSSEIKARV
jgi:hypothetical protein